MEYFNLESAIFPSSWYIIGNNVETTNIINTLMYNFHSRFKKIIAFGETQLMCSSIENNIEKWEQMYSYEDPFTLLISENGFPQRIKNLFELMTIEQHVPMFVANKEYADGFRLFYLASKTNFRQSKNISSFFGFFVPRRCY